jgi:hypothetical protein
MITVVMGSRRLVVVMVVGVVIAVMVVMTVVVPVKPAHGVTPLPNRVK